MITIPEVLTAAEFTTLPGDGFSELVRGRFVPLPLTYWPHGVVCVNVACHLAGIPPTERRHGIAVANSWIQTEWNPDSVRGPDILYIHPDKLPGGKFPNAVLTVPVDLVVEILSPSDRWPDMLDKVGEYLRSGISEAWIVDPDQRVVDVHRDSAAPLRFTSADTLTRPELLPGFSCPVAEFFADI